MNYKNLVIFSGFSALAIAVVNISNQIPDQVNAFMADHIQKIDKFTNGINNNISSANATISDHFEKNTNGGIYGSHGLRKLLEIKKISNDHSTMPTVDIEFNYYDDEGNVSTTKTSNVIAVCSDGSFITKDESVEKEKTILLNTIYGYPQALDSCFYMPSKTSQWERLDSMSNHCQNAAYSLTGSKLNYCKNHQGQLRLSNTGVRRVVDPSCPNAAKECDMEIYNLECKMIVLEPKRGRWEFKDDSIVTTTPYQNYYEISKRNIVASEDTPIYIDDESTFASFNGCVNVDKNFLDEHAITERTLFEYITSKITKRLASKGVIDIRLDGKTLGSKDIDNTSNEHTWTFYTLNFENQKSTDIDFDVDSATGENTEFNSINNNDKDIMHKQLTNLDAAGSILKNDKEFGKINGGGSLSALSKSISKKKLNDKEFARTDSIITKTSQKAQAESFVGYESEVRHFANETERNLNVEVDDKGISYNSTQQTPESIKKSHDDNQLAFMNTSAPVQVNSHFEAGKVIQKDSIYYEPRSCLVSANVAFSYLNNSGATASQSKKKLNSKVPIEQNLYTEAKSCSIVVNTEPVTKNNKTYKSGTLVTDYICPVDKEIGEYAISGVEGVTDASSPDNPCRPLKEFKNYNIAKLAIANEVSKEVSSKFKDQISISPNQDLEQIKDQIKVFKGSKYSIQDVLRKFGFASNSEEQCCMNDEGDYGGKYDAYALIFDDSTTQSIAQPYIKELLDIYTRWKNNTEAINQKCFSNNALNVHIDKSASDKECDYATNRHKLIKSHDREIEDFCERNEKVFTDKIKLDCRTFAQEVKSIWNLQYGLYFADGAVAQNQYMPEYWKSDSCGSSRGSCSLNKCNLSWAYAAAMGELKPERKVRLKDMLSNLIIINNFFPKLPNTKKCLTDENHIKLATKQLQGGCFFTGFDYDVPSGLQALFKRARYYRTYCCVDSELAKVIQDEAGKQFKKTPTEMCDGISLDELETLDFEKMDMNRIVAALGVNTADIKEKMQKRKENDLKITDKNGKVIDSAGLALPQDDADSLDDINLLKPQSANTHSYENQSKNLAPKSVGESANKTKKDLSDNSIKAFIDDGLNNNEGDTDESNLLIILGEIERADALDKKGIKSGLTNNRKIELFNELNNGVTTARAQEIQRELNQYVQNRNNKEKALKGDKQAIFNDLIQKMNSKAKQEHD